MAGGDFDLYRVLAELVVGFVGDQDAGFELHDAAGRAVDFRDGVLGGGAYVVVGGPVVGDSGGQVQAIAIAEQFRGPVGIAVTEQDGDLFAVVYLAVAVAFSKSDGVFFDGVIEDIERAMVGDFEIGADWGGRDGARFNHSLRETGAYVNFILVAIEVDVETAFGVGLRAIAMNRVVAQADGQEGDWLVFGVKWRGGDFHAGIGEKPSTGKPLADAGSEAGAGYVAERCETALAAVGFYGPVPY